MSEICYWLTIFQLLLPALCVLNFSRSIAQYGFMWVGLAGLTLYQVILFTVPLLLGNIRHLEVPTYRTTMLTIGAILALRTIFGLKALGRALIALRYRPRWVDPFLIFCSILALNLWITELFSAWRAGPSEFDASNYHIPRALLWSWHGNFDGWGTATWQQLGAAFGGSASLLPSIFLGCGFVTFSWTGTLYSLGASLGVFVIGRSLGLSCRASYVSLLAFLIFPSVALRVSGISTDIAATFPVIAAVAIFLSIQRIESKFFFFPALLGLGMACKQYVLFSGTPIGLFLVIKNWRSLRQTRVITAGIAGVGVALFFLFLSYFPIYVMFGDLMGGPAGRENSNLGRSLQAVIGSLAYQFIHWLSEPVSAISNQTVREHWYFKLGFGELYGFFGLHSGKHYIPDFNGNSLRSGLLPFAALPIIIFGVKRGYRWSILLGFLTLCVIQLAPLALNTTGRFLIIPLAGFALLWGVRSEKYPILVTLCVIGAYWGTRARLNIQMWLPDTSLKLVTSYSECKQLPDIIGSESISLLTRPLANDSKVAGRLGLAKFEYAYCPADQNWPKYIDELKTKSRWFAMYPERPLAAGVNYPSKLGYPCRDGRVELEQMKSWLDAAGWHFVTKLECGIEVYRCDTPQSQMQ